MTAILEVEKRTFSVARLYATDQTGQKYLYAEARDVTIDIKSDLKEYFAEGTFAAGVANGHSSIDLTWETYRLRLQQIALEYGLSAPVANTFKPIQDETQTIDAAAHTVVLANAPIANSEVVYVIHTASNGTAYRVPYLRVASGPTGNQYSISGSTLTFPAGDASLQAVVSYDTTDATGSQITLSNVPQNSGTYFNMECVKYDISPIDGSKGFFIATLKAVRAAGLNIPSKEGEWNTYKRQAKAFQDPSGNVAVFTFVNA